jgi:hypothetical protein
MTAEASELTSTCQTSILDCLQESSKGTDNGEEANTSLGSSASELRSRGLGAGGLAASGGSLGRNVGSSGVLAGVGGVGGNDRGNGSAVDGGDRLGGNSLGGLGGHDDGGGVRGDGQGGGLGDRVGLLLVGNNGRSGADVGGLLDDLGGGHRVLNVLGAGRSDRVGSRGRDGVALRVDGSGSLVLGGRRRGGVALRVDGGRSLVLGGGGGDRVGVVTSRAGGSRGRDSVGGGRGAGLVDGVVLRHGLGANGADGSDDSEGTHFDCVGWY